MSYSVNRGLGASVVHPTACDSGTDLLCSPSTDCSDWWTYMLNPVCLTSTLTSWQALKNVPPPPAPVLPIPAVPTQTQLDSVAASPNPAAAAQALVNSLATDAASTAITADQVANQQFFNDYAAQLAAQANQPPPVDCSGFFSFLNSSCPGSGLSIPSWVWVALGVTGGILILKAVK